jgi:D-cysteine desulfhydrase/L-cysteate sulfo-lyase
MDRVLTDVAEEQRRLGRHPYVMNHNPAFAIGSALAYVLCALEIVEQSAEAGIEPTHLYMASGNKGHAGLLLARELLGARYRPVAISQHYGDDRVSGALEGARAAAEALGYETRLTESDVESYDEFVETSYGAPSERGMEAIRLAARTEGLLLDPIYTGKALAGLIEHARLGKVGPESTVVFVHTGGQPALFSFADALVDAFPQVANGRI